MLSRKRTAALAVLLTLFVAFIWTGRATLLVSKQSAHEPAAVAEESKQIPLHEDERTVSDAERLDALARAQVWRQPRMPIRQADLGRESTAPNDLTCRFVPGASSGTTPKFDCDIAGLAVRIKYGAGPEIPAEALATRLLRTLGFGADSVTLIPRLHCIGCPPAPFVIAKVVDMTNTDELYERTLDYGEYKEFEWVALEHKLDARPIRTAKLEGWSFYELDRIDPAKGGAPREHVDALRLLAVFLAHWDNKAENQRLVCLSDPWREDTPCPRPFAMVQDLGATFGPHKLDLNAWKNAAIFEDRASCQISMRELPYDGATFESVRIGDAGRRFLARLLGELSERQLSDLFAGARVDRKRGPLYSAWPVSEWVSAFKARVRTISEGPPCPTT